MTAPPQPSKGVALTNWMVSKAAGLLERKTGRRGFLVGSAMVGSAVAVAGLDPIVASATPYQHITDCASGLCTDGYTEFCCTINNGVNACPTGSFAGGWWRADYSSFCNGTRYYIDCMQNCCGPATGYQNFCAGCVECSCGGDCNSRRIYCNYFRYGQCHQEIVASGPIACRVVTCTPPYNDASLACTTAAAVDNSTAEHTSAHPCVTPFVSAAVLPDTGATAVGTPGTVSVFARRSDGGVMYREFGGTWGPTSSLTPTINSGLATAVDSTGLYLFGRGTDKGIWWQRRTSGVWTGWKALGPTAAGDPTAVAHSSGVYVFVRGADSSVWYQRYTAGAWSGWRSLAGTTTSDPVAVTDPTGLYVFVRGADNGIWYQRFTGTSWGPAWLKLGPTATSDPAAVSDPTGVYVFVRGADNAVWYQRLSAGAWSGWKSLAGTATSDPAVVSDPSGLYVFVRGTDNGVWYRRFTAGSWGTGWQKLGPTAITSPTVVSDSSGLFVFVCGLDRALWYQRYAAGAWSGWQSLGGTLAPQHALN
jgi:hypothetical protein